MLIEKYVVTYLVLMNKISWIDSTTKAMKNGVYTGISVILDNNQATDPLLLCLLLEDINVS